MVVFFLVVAFFDDHPQEFVLHYDIGTDDTRMWADAQHDGRPAEYRWRPLRKFRHSIPCTMPQSLVDPTAGVPCSNAANTGECKTWTQSEFHMWQISVRGQEPPKMYI